MILPAEMLCYQGELYTFPYTTRVEVHDSLESTRKTITSLRFKAFKAKSQTNKTMIAYVVCMLPAFLEIFH